MLSLHGDELAIPFDFIAPSLDVMLENLNNSLFYFINATPDSAQWIISLAIFIAKRCHQHRPALSRGTLAVGAPRSGLRPAPADR